MTTEKHSIEYLNRSLLDPSPTNPRKHFDPEALQELAASLRMHGVMQNLLVRPHPKKPGRYEVVSGERRFRASEIGKLEELPCAIREMTDEEVLELQIVENLQREDISPVEEADGYLRMLELTDEAGKPRFSVESLADRIKKSEQYVKKRLGMAKAPKRLQEAVARGEVAIRIGELVGNLPLEEMRRSATQRILEPETQLHPLTVDQTIDLIRTEFLVSLKDSFFDQEDAGLTEAPACSVCPLRTGNAPAMEGLLQKPGPGGRRGVHPDLCLNPSCFREKEACAWAKATEELPSDVEGVLSQQDAASIFSPTVKGVLAGADWVDLADKPGYEDLGHFDETKVATWKVMLKDAPGVPVQLARSPHTGRIHKVVRRDLAVAAVDEAAREKGAVSPFEHRPSGAEDEERFAKEKQRKADEKKKRSAEAIAALKALGSALPEYAGSAPLAWAHLRTALIHAGKDGCALLARGYLEMRDVPLELSELVDAIMGFAKDNVESNAEIGNEPVEIIGLWLTLALVARDLAWDGKEAESFELMATVVSLGEVV